MLLLANCLASLQKPASEYLTALQRRLKLSESLKEGGLDKRIEDRLSKLDVDDVKELAKAGAEIREWIEKAPFRLSSKKKSENTMSGSRATRRKFPLLFVPLQLLKTFRTLPLPASRKLT